MAWTWRYEDSDGGRVPNPPLPAEEFPSQADAETWLGEVWRDLLDGGVMQVSLLEDGRVVYGGMSLLPAG
jgi:hypothetical protein